MRQVKQPPSYALHVGKGFFRASNAKQGQVNSLGPAYRRDESCPVGNLEMHAGREKFMQTFRLAARVDRLPAGWNAKVN